MINRPVHVLIVEDNEEQAGALVETCRSTPLDPSPLVEVAGSREQALEFIEREEFDLAICDLSIPLDGPSGSPDREHGRAVLDVLLNQVCGTPMIVCSEREEAIGGLVRRGAQGDPFGQGTDSPMLSFFNKEELPECKRQIKDFIARAGQAAAVELGGPGSSELKHGEGRAIQVYIRRNNGVSANLRKLGGNSAEKTLRVDVFDSRSELIGQVVAKVGARARIRREASKFRAMAGRLPPELMVAQADVVDVGAGRVAGLFYGLADNFDRDLFNCLSNDESAACSVVEALRRDFAALHQSGNSETKLFSMLRREIVGNDRLDNAAEWEDSIRRLDDVQVQVSSCMQHGDLHGENVLVDRSGTPILIDYAKTSAASGCLDPVTLELSAVFHPGAQGARGDWPSEGQISAWRDLDAYLVGCPFPAFVRAARLWINAVASSEQEVDAIVLAYALRQLRYSASIRPLALALIGAAHDGLTGAGGSDSRQPPLAG